MQIFQGLFVVECLALGLDIWESWEAQLHECQSDLPLCMKLGLVLLYLIGRCAEGLPVNAGNDVADKLRLEF